MIGLSVKSKYGLAAMVELARRYQDGATQIRDIADAHSIPQSYLEQLLVALKKAGLVKSFRGCCGGYALAQDPALVMVSDILLCLEGGPDFFEPSDTLAFYWQQAERKVLGVFQVSLADVLLDQQRAQNVVNYAI